MATLLIGYDVESRREPEITRKFLTLADTIHTRYGVPATYFVVGQTLEASIPHFQRAAENPLIEFGQHTYSHRCLKTNVHIWPDQHVTIDRSGSVAEIEVEVERTQALIREHLRRECIGFTAPTGCYEGLCDRPDLLAVLHGAGIRYVRTFQLNRRDFDHWALVPHEVQPFWYEPQGFPDVLEFPIQGRIDCTWLDAHGYDRRDEYLRLTKASIDYCLERDLAWTYVQHDWSSQKGDPEMSCTAAVIEYALERGMEIVTYGEYYRRAKAGQARVGTQSSALLAHTCPQKWP